MSWGTGIWFGSQQRSVLGCEKLLGMVKHHQRKKIGRMPIMRSVLGAKVIGVKLAERRASGQEKLGK
jgi:hypothetical protein